MFSLRLFRERKGKRPRGETRGTARVHGELVCASGRTIGWGGGDGGGVCGVGGEVAIIAIIAIPPSLVHYVALFQTQEPAQADGDGGKSLCR